MRRTPIIAGALAVLLLFLGLGAMTASAATNLLANPGFESGLSSWSCAAGDSVVSGGAHGGTSSLAGATTGSDTAQCTQTVTVVPNSHYTLTAWVKGTYVYLGITGGASIWTPSATSWSQLSTSFDTGASTTSVQVFLHGWYAQGTYGADDVVLAGPGSGPSPSPSPTVSPTPSPTPTVSPSPSPSPSPTPTITPTPPPPGAWHPNYLAIGTVYTPGSTVDTFFTQLATHGPLPNYGYKYLLGNELANWASVAGTQVSSAKKLGMTPVLVEYGMNGNIDGADAAWNNMKNSGWVSQFFTSLKAAAQSAASKAGGTPVGWIIEPDMLGYIQQGHGSAYGNDATKISAATSAAYSSGVLGSGDPTYPNTLTGLVQAINHTIKKYNPSAFIGWQVNTWAVRSTIKDTDTMGVTAGHTSIVNTANQVAAFLTTAKIGSEADLVAFDQWGQDFGYFRDPNPAGNIRYLNATHWNNYLLYVKTIRAALNRPGVLWQIAAGHLNSTRTASPTYWNSSGTFPDLDDVSPNRYQDSASTYFFGDRFATSGNYLSFFGSNADGDPKVSVSGGTVTWGSHIPEAAAAGIVAIMFGAGTGTGTYNVPEMVGAYQSTPSDYYYWATRTQSYLRAPTPL
ncbi:carbohydrate binding domain-containing protein [Planotetraspora sp. A-T 1434]|uniref:carbohydrate binding domain-containing protein n=1 Tax=Planotetraspora sp. A-T 1434 TaxID=2979219 RepID=UPI0021BFACAB|nr:carbohydrate binding domain-containing protein [Planotetraspora sp. A-T 1434]MCT9933621.1 carbohydrate binding domain-containing protein [Planotetraspora sp. A-T 1434]